MKLRFYIVFLVVSINASAEQALLHIKAKFVGHSGYYPASTCEDENDCIPWSYWNIYSAKVKKVVKGEFKERRFKFALLQHSRYVDHVLKDMYVLVGDIRSLELVEQLGTKYYAKDWGFPERVVCFDTDLNSEFPNDSKTIPEYGNCYSEDELFDDDA